MFCLSIHRFGLKMAGNELLECSYLLILWKYPDNRCFQMENWFKLHRMFGLAQVEYHSWKNNWQDIGPDSWMTNICHSNAFPPALWQSSEAMWATLGNWWSRSRRRSSQLATSQCTHFAKRRTAHSTSSHRTQYITAPLSGRCTLTFTLEVPFLPPLKVNLGGVWISTVKLLIFCTIEIEI